MGAVFNVIILLYFYLKNGVRACVVIFLSLLCPSGSWLLSGKLAKMLLNDCEQNDNDNPLALSGMFSSSLF